METELAVRPLSPAEVCIVGPESVNEWRERYRMKVPGAEHTRLFKKKQWDGTWAPGRWCRKRPDGSTELRMSRGFFPRFCDDFMVEKGIVATDVDAWLATAPRATELRDFQETGVRKVLEAGWGRVAYATNAGKGAVIALLARYAKDHGHRCLIMCDEVAVFEALTREVKMWGGLTPAIVSAGVQDPPRGAVTLAMVPTLARRVKDDETWREWVATQTMVLLDEADKADANTWRLILEAAKNSAWRAGFSGSFPEDPYQNLRLEGLCGPILEQIKNKELVERGISARPTIEVRAFDAGPSVRAAVATIEDKRWWKEMAITERRAHVFEEVIVADPARHAFIRDAIDGLDHVVVIVTHVDHGLNLQAVIPGALFLSGKDSVTSRDHYLTKFERGDIRVLIVTRILDRGSNRLGHAKTIVFASSEGSAAQTLQRIGRGLRRGGGKEALRLIDVVDRVRDADCLTRKIEQATMFLRNGVQKRLRLYQTEGFDVEFRR